MLEPGHTTINLTVVHVAFSGVEQSIQSKLFPHTMQLYGTQRQVDNYDNQTIKTTARHRAMFIFRMKGRKGEDTGPQLRNYSWCHRN